MLYAIICEDSPNSAAARAEARAAHLARLEDLQAQGRLVLAGPFPAIDSTDPGPAGFVGSLIVADFANQQEAQRWAEADPFILSGAYANVEVKPFKQVYP
ncbi:MAG TPA: hypothetical protein DCZ03_11300 [Gammaproteobacteria bacterium]|nr:hypothetical protein [Gammaproteobacteria bacterium]